jgi:hypothetical protein
MYPAVISLIEIALTNWSSYDGWCLSKGIDPLELPSRRFVNSVWNWLTEEMEAETINNLLDALHQVSYQQPTRLKRSIPSVETEPKGENNGVEYNSKSKWKAPEGWTPPGWDEEASYKNAMTFIDSKNSNFSK